jgi:hypothetical protein
MGSQYQMDFGGMDLVCNDVRGGSTSSGNTGTATASSAIISGITAGTAAASKALVLNSSSGITTGLTLLTATTLTTGALNTTGLTTHGAAATQKANSGAHTCTSNATTTTTQYSVITTESLTTAHTATQAIVVTYTGTASTDHAVATIIGGTNTGGVPVLKTACTTDTVTITIQNNAIATNAFNGTFIIWLQVFKA